MAAWRPGRLSIDVPVMLASSWMLSVICLMVMRTLAIVDQIRPVGWVTVVEPPVKLVAAPFKVLVKGSKS